MEIGVVSGTLIILVAATIAVMLIYKILNKNKNEPKVWHADPFIERVAKKPDRNFQVVTSADRAGVTPKGHRDLGSIKEALDAYLGKPGPKTLLPLQTEIGVLKPPLTAQEAAQIGTTLEEIGRIMAAQ